MDQVWSTNSWCESLPLIWIALPCFGHVLVLGCMFCGLHRSRFYCARYACVFAVFDGDPF